MPHDDFVWLIFLHRFLKSLILLVLSLYSFKRAGVLLAMVFQKLNSVYLIAHIIYIKRMSMLFAK